MCDDFFLFIITKYFHYIFLVLQCTLRCWRTSELSDFWRWPQQLTRSKRIAAETSAKIEIVSSISITNFLFWSWSSRVVYYLNDCPLHIIIIIIAISDFVVFVNKILLYLLQQFLRQLLIIFGVFLAPLVDRTSSHTSGSLLIVLASHE